MAIRVEVSMTDAPDESVTADKAWSERWHAGNIGFHQSEHNLHLLNHWPVGRLSKGSVVLVPLCGKSRDMTWLRFQGYRVVGIELVELACKAFFEGGLFSSRFY